MEILLGYLMGELGDRVMTEDTLIIIILFLFCLLLTYITVTALHGVGLIP